MPTYAWKNTKTGEVVEVDRPMSQSDIPPNSSGDWERVYSFGVGRMEGGGGSPARPSLHRG